MTEMNKRIKHFMTKSMKAFLPLMILPLLSLAAPKPQLPDVVRTFYDGMQRMGSVTNSNDAAILQEQMAKCFPASDGGSGISSGITLNNDFRVFMKTDPSPTKSSTLYTMQLYDFIYLQKVLSVKYKILNCEWCSTPDLMSSSNNEFISCYVEKTFVFNGKNYLFNDTVQYCVAERYISGILSGSKKENIDINGLLSKAAYYYSHGEKKKSYDTYRYVIERDPKNAQALYYYGILSYYDVGHIYKSKKRAREAACEYVLKAMKNSKDEKFKNRASIAYDRLAKRGGGIVL